MRIQGFLVPAARFIIKEYHLGARSSSPTARLSLNESAKALAEWPTPHEDAISITNETNAVFTNRTLPSQIVVVVGQCELRRLALVGPGQERPFEACPLCIYSAQY